MDELIYEFNSWRYLVVLSSIKKDYNNKSKIRMYCSSCGEYGHKNIKSNECSIKITEQQMIRSQIKRHILDTPISHSCGIEEILVEIADKLGIKITIVASLYKDINPYDLLDRKIEIKKIIDEQEKLQCSSCNKELIITNIDSIRKWKSYNVCDKCWCKFNSDRDELWVKIQEYKRIVCVSCGEEKKDKNERYHFDHINMFDKQSSICTMVNCGDEIEDIFREIDKCQIVCKHCHDIITSIENRLGFTRIKSTLTRRLNSEEITEDQYNDEKKVLQKIYENKMAKIYEELKHV